MKEPKAAAEEPDSSSRCKPQVVSRRGPSTPLFAQIGLARQRPQTHAHTPLTPLSNPNKFRRVNATRQTVSMAADRAASGFRQGVTNHATIHNTWLPVDSSDGAAEPFPRLRVALMLLVMCYPCITYRASAYQNVGSFMSWSLFSSLAAEAGSAHRGPVQLHTAAQSANHCTGSSRLRDG